MTPLKAEAISAESADDRAASTAIALRNKEVEVSGFYRRESRARGRGVRRRPPPDIREAARQAGDRAGRRAKIGPDREFGAPRGALE